MNDVTSMKPFDSDVTTAPDDAWSNLMALARMVRVDEAAGTLTLVNGKSKLTLRRDGTIRIEGVSIVQSAERGIALDAATIDLN